MTALALATSFAAGRPAKAALPTRLVPFAVQDFDPGDVLGTPARPGPSFQLAAYGSLTLQEITPLNFGTVAAPTSGTASLVLDPCDNSLDYDSTGGLISSGSHTRAVFHVTNGSSDRSYSVYLLSSTISIGGGCTAGSFKIWSQSDGSSTPVTDHYGNDTLYIGGTASIPSTASAGSYTSSGSIAVWLLQNTKLAADSLDNVALTVAKPLTLTRTNDLAFGDVVPGSTAGTVVLSTSGARSSTGGVTLGNGLTAAAGGFSLNGQPNTSYNLTVSPSTLTLSAGANSMTVDAWTTNPASPGTLPAAPPQAVSVGGTLHVGAHQATGTYSGIFTATVAYQ